MKYCARCMYPENAKPTIIIDPDDGICSGCKYHMEKENLNIDWDEREKMFSQIVDEAKKLAKERNNLYDCILPVSGGKDSHFQAYILKEKYDMNALMVTYNHCFNTPAGIRNLENLVEKAGFDLVRFTANAHAVKEISRYMIETVGDLTWHYHAGIATLPFRVAVEKNIPFVMWGEEGYGELTGMFSINDFPEFKKWSRKEHNMRGYEPEDIVNSSKGKITLNHLAPYIYPDEEDIERTGVRGIYMGNYFFWNAKLQAEEMMRKWDFAAVSFKRDRTFNLFAKIEDHANDVHDYLKYLKFGYGRATDDASTEIRLRRLSRAEAAKMVTEYDGNEPSTLSTYLEFLEMDKDSFYNTIDRQRDPAIWENSGGTWKMTDHVSNYLEGKLVENSKLPLIDDRTFDKKNKELYFNDDDPPEPKGDERLDINPLKFKFI